MRVLRCVSGWKGASPICRRFCSINESHLRAVLRASQPARSDASHVCRDIPKPKIDMCFGLCAMSTATSDSNREFIPFNYQWVELQDRKRSFSWTAEMDAELNEKSQNMSPH